MPLNFGDVVPLFSPAAVTLNSKVYRPAINMISSNQYNSGSTAASGSTTYPGSDNDPAQRAGRFRLPKLYPLVGAPSFKQTEYTAPSFLINEIYAGFPPFYGYDAGDSTPGNIYAPADGVIPTAGYPNWWLTLKNEGYKRNGPAIFLEYPGGPEAFFDRFTKVYLSHSLALIIDPDVMCSEPIYNSPSYVIPAPTLQKMANYTGIICCNVEGFWPYTRPHVYQNNFMGTYLDVFREVMRRLNGVYPSDQVLAETYWDLAWRRFIIPYLKLIKTYCPKATVGIYDLPIGTSQPLVAPYNSYWMELMDEELGGGQDELWKQVDYLAPSHGYLYYPIVTDDTVSVPSGYVKYSYYLYLHSGTTDRCVALRDYCGKPLYVFSRMTMGASGAPARNGTVINDLESRCLAHICDMSKADGAIIWDEVGSTYFAGATTLEAQLQVLQAGYTSFSTYYNSIARTPRT